MIHMNVLVSQLIELFIILCLGYFMCKRNILNEDVNKHINALIVNITMPCMILNAVLSIDSSARPEASTLGLLFAVSIGFFLIMPVISFLLVKGMLKAFHIVKARQGAYMFMMIFSNVGFMGIPILRAATGDQAPVAVFYAAIFNIFFNIAVFTYGVIMIGYGDSANTKFQFKKLLSPGILSALFALLIYLTQFHFPPALESVDHAIGTVGELTPALAMMLVGSTLATMKIRDVFNEWRIYIFAVLKQILLPILLYPLYQLLIPDKLLLNVMFIEFLMPVANVALILCTQYNLDKKFASKVIFITTLMSLVTIPVVFYLCNLIYS
ncbi:MAG: AEC family transporter [Eubacterium sp.]|nr:AEC family transporter [Eubacterium sp.]